MALNLKEKAEFARLQDEVRIARALRWTEPVARDLPAPREAGSASQGWDCDGVVVYRAWSLHSSYGRGIYTDDQSRQKLYPACRPIYSTELRALRALRCELERKAAEALAAIDARIEQLKGAA
jgi:hypothetical protein